MHEPLSQRLAKILEADAAQGGLTLNELLLRTEGRGLYLVIIILSVPFITPVPLPGVSMVIGVVIGLLAFRLSLGLPPVLPRFMGERELPTGVKRAVLGGSVRFLRWVERFAKPRRTQWLGWPLARTGHAVLILFMSLLLMLPIPPVILFSNSLPSLAIVLIAVSMMEEDGVMIWFAYAASLASVLWLAVSAGLIAAFFSKAYARLMEYLQAAP